MPIPRTTGLLERKEDPRVTKVSKILRKTNIDESPQFVNIQKREMAVVGPRAEEPEFVEELKREFPFCEIRYSVQPRMVG